MPLKTPLPSPPPFPTTHELLAETAGFNDPWERALLKGRDLKLEATLAEQGMGEGEAMITTVRRVLVAEGWKVRIWLRTSQAVGPALPVERKMQLSGLAGPNRSCRRRRVLAAFLSAWHSRCLKPKPSFVSVS
jgi:hypothetical protein